MTSTDYMCLEKKKEEEDLPALKIALMLRYSDSKTTKKSAVEETILTRRGSIEKNT